MVSNKYWQNVWVLPRAFQTIFLSFYNILHCIHTAECMQSLTSCTCILHCISSCTCKMSAHGKTPLPVVSCIKQVSGFPHNPPTKLFVVTICYCSFKAQCPNAESKKLETFSVRWDVSIQYHSLLHAVLTP